MFAVFVKDRNDIIVIEFWHESARMRSVLVRLYSAWEGAPVASTCRAINLPYSWYGFILLDAYWPILLSSCQRPSKRSKREEVGSMPIRTGAIIFESLRGNAQGEAA